MSSINQELLTSSEEHLLFSPAILTHMRQHTINYSTYFDLLTKDMARGFQPLAWGNQLAEEGNLTVARECWRAAGLEPAVIEAKYQQYEIQWRKRIASALSVIRESRNALHRMRGLKPEEERQCDQSEDEAEGYADKGWFDLAQETLLRVQARLYTLQGSIEQQRLQERGELLQTRDRTLEAVADPACSLPSGEEGKAAIRRLLEGLEALLEPVQWNIKAAMRRLDLARALSEGGAYDSSAVAQAMGEKPVAPKEEKKEIAPDILREVGLMEPTPQAAPTPPPPTTPETAPPQASPAAPYPRPVGPDLHRYRTESVAIQRQADHERSITKNFKHAEWLFKRALQLWPGNETAAKNYSTMLRHLSRTEEAVAVLEEELQYAQERLPIYNLLTNFCTDIAQYGKAREYGQKALRLVGDPRSEIGVLTNLYTVEIKAGDYRKALEYNEAILRLDPKHEHMRKNKERLEAMLAGAPQPAENLYETPDTVTELNIEISPLIREDLEKCELTKVSPRAARSHDITKVLEECLRLRTETTNLYAEQYRERADYFLQSAKLLSQFVNGLQQISDDERDDERRSRLTEDEMREIEKELSDALGTYTGVMGDRYYAQGNMDSARDYYLEHARVYRQTLPLLTRRRIAKYFQSFIPESSSVIGVQDFERRLSHHVIPELIERTIQEADSSIREDVARGVLELACTSELISSYITRALRANEDFRQLFRPLLDILIKQQGTQSFSGHMGSEEPSDIFLHLVNHRQLSIQQQQNQLSGLLGSMGDKYRLEEADRELSLFADYQREWSATDRASFASLRDLVRDSIAFFYQEGQFSYREHLAHSILSKADSLRKRLDNEPTSLGRTYIARIVYQLKRLVENAFQDMEREALPRLVVSVVQTRWRDYNHVRECHIEVINEGESPALDVSVHVLPSETGDYLDDPRAHPIGTISARHSATVPIPVTLRSDNGETTSKDAVDLLICLNYYDRERKIKETPPTRLRLSLRDELQFTRFENPYQTGLPIVDSPMFVGRQELIEELSYEMTRSGRTSAIVIYGQKRSGKTSILRNLETHLTTHKPGTYETILPVYFSMQSILATNEWLEPGMFLLIAQGVAQKCYEAGLGDQIGELTAKELMEMPGPEIQFRTYLSRLLRLPSTRLVLLIDEFTELAARIDEGRLDRSIMKFLKSLIEQGFFSCVICGIDTMPQVLNKYSNELAVSDPRTIGYLSHEAARQLIEDPIRLPDGKSRYTSPQVVEEIIRLTAGSPFYIQFVCQRLVDYMNRETRSATITGADVDHVVNSLISTLDPYTKFDNLTRYKGDESEDTYASTLEGLFLYLLADETRQNTSASFNSICQRAQFLPETEFLNIADQLEERQVIERIRSTTRQYKIVVDLFRRWINAKRPMDDEALTRFQSRLEKLKRR
jgi:tetratricopeptide (TPR) repeat protein